MAKNKWWETRVLRSVDNLKLWVDNPRLDPSSKLVTVRDYAEELIRDPIDAQNLTDLLNSIVSRGFQSFDPVVVWQDSDSKSFFVAEGNRRVLALKLLRSPTKAPMQIRKAIVDLSRKIDRDEIEKIKVCVAPSYEESRWYILQRHSAASNQVRWQRLQQQRFIISVYDSVGQDIEETISITGFKRAAIIDALRFVKIRDIATRLEVTKYLSLEEKEKVLSHKINMTVLERWFGNSQVREKWHITFDENGLSINADPNSFYKAYAKFLKAMLTKDSELGFIINTRTIDSNFQEIFEFLPEVKLVGENDDNEPVINPEADKDAKPGEGKSDDDNKPEPRPSTRGNPKRRQLTDKYHGISTSSFKVNALFNELQLLPILKYPNLAAASIRIFLELSVDEYIEVNELKSTITQRLQKGYHECSLKQKVTFLHAEFIDDRDANKVIDQLQNNSNDFSLNTLNEYVHDTKGHKVEPQFLNRFWDMLTPLFSVLIDLKEK